MKPKILMVLPSIPCSSSKGFEVIPYYRIINLSEQYDISLAYIEGDSNDGQKKEKLVKYIDKFYSIKNNIFMKLRSLVSGIFLNIPLQVLLYSDKSIKLNIEKIIESNEFNIINFYMLRMTNLLPLKNLNDENVVIDYVDSMYLNFSRRIEKASFINKIIYKEEVRRLKIYETKISERYKGVVVSNIDKDFLKGNTVSIPIGVDVSEFKPIKKITENKYIVFTGNMYYSPNNIAVLWFLKNCWVDIKKNNPNLEFYIAGNKPSHDVQFYDGKNGVKVLGRVDSMSEVIYNACAAVAPMQSGSGMQFKILEAMSCGVPVITTNLGLGDIQAIEGQEILIADSSEDFIKAVNNILNSKILTENLSEKGRDLVLKYYSWESHCEKIIKIYRNITD